MLPCKWNPGSCISHILFLLACTVTTHQGWKTNERPLLDMPAEWNTTTKGSKYVNNTQVPGKHVWLSTHHSCPPLLLIQALKAAEDHILAVTTERSYYKDICKKSKENLVKLYTTNEQFNPPLPGARIPPLSNDTIIHYSFDMAQQVTVCALKRVYNFLMLCSVVLQCVKYSKSSVFCKILCAASVVCYVVCCIQ